MHLVGKCDRFPSLQYQSSTQDILCHQLLKLIDCFSQAQQASETTNFIYPCKILHTSGIRLLANFAD